MPERRSLEALLAAIQSGIASGHETCLTALERLVLSETGVIDLQTSTTGPLLVVNDLR
jgi:hypothetical protein